MDASRNLKETNEDMSPLVERLKNLITSQRKSQEKSTEYLTNFKNNTPPVLVKDNSQCVSLGYDNESYCSPELRRPKDCATQRSNNAATLMQSPLSRPVLQDAVNVSLSRSVDEQTTYSPEKGTGLFHEVKENVEVLKKFPYLKKSVGKFRRLKGFKKNSEIKPRLAVNELKLNCVLLKKPEPISSVAVSSDDDAKIPKKSSSNSGKSLSELNAFEALEEMAEHQSFISTSSTVLDLLSVDHSSCSTPVQNYNLFSQNERISFKYKPSTSHFVDRNNFNFSPVMKDLERLVGYDQLPSYKSDEATQTGILKRNLNSSNESSRCTTPKHGVKFLHKGVRVLEYDNDAAVTQNESLYSDDSDLITVSNVSDIENLAMLGCNFQVVHELTATNERGLVEKKVTRRVNINERQLVGSPKLAERFFQGHAMVNEQYPNFSTKIIQKSSAIPSSHEDTDLHSHKLLLLSRIAELDKEINLFKTQNCTKERLIKELNEKMLEQTKTAATSIAKRTFCPYQLDSHRETKISNCDSLASKETETKETKRMNGKIVRLTNENCELKKKLTSFVKKVKDLEDQVKVVEGKDQNDNAINLREKQNSAAPNQVMKTNVSSPKSKVQLHIAKKTDMKQSLTLRDNNSNQMIVEDDLESTERAYRKERINLYDACQANDLKAVTRGSETKDNMSQSAEYHSLNHETDVERVNYSDRIVITYKSDKIVRTVYCDGKQVIEFANGQRETYYKDGSHCILSPDKSSDSVFRNGSRKLVAADGTTTNINKDGTKDIHFPNGQIEIHLCDQVKRIYPDGTTKTLYNDGSTETRYSNGKIRFKQKDGTVMLR